MLLSSITGCLGCWARLLQIKACGPASDSLILGHVDGRMVQILEDGKLLEMAAFHTDQVMLGISWPDERISSICLRCARTRQGLVGLYFGNQ